VNSVWYAAFALLAFVVLLNSALLVGAMRQIGVLQQRVRPTGAGSADGPEIGARLPLIDLVPVAGSPDLDVFSRDFAVLVFVTPGCALCDQLVPSAHAVARSGLEEGVLLALVTNAGGAQAAAYANAKHVEVPFLRAEQLVEAWGLPGSPYVLCRGETRTAWAASSQPVWRTRLSSSRT
jgi:hypothetical protein